MINRSKTKIGSVARSASDDLNYKAHAEDGLYFLTDLATAAPTDVYYGFIVNGESTVISAITYINDIRIGGDITAATLPQGLYVPLKNGFSTITVSAGQLILLKYIDKQ